jgi:hypothetical protein
MQLNAPGHPPPAAPHALPAPVLTLALKLAPSRASTLPHWSTASRMEPLYMSILALRSVRYAPCCASSTAAAAAKQARGARNQLVRQLITRTHDAWNGDRHHRATLPLTLLVARGEHDAAALIAHDALCHPDRRALGAPRPVHDHLGLRHLRGGRVWQTREISSPCNRLARCCLEGAPRAAELVVRRGGPRAALLAPQHPP